MRRASLAWVALWLVAFAPVTSARAGGLLAQEIAAPRNGTAQAGGAAYASDAATAVYNPAGMARIPGRKVMLGVQPIFSDIEFDPGPATTIAGGDGDDQGGFAGALGSFVVWPLTDRVAVGGGLVGLAGGALDPDGDWAGRFLVTDLQLVVLAVNPAVSVRVNDWLSLGFGASLNYGRLDFELALPRLGNALDAAGADGPLLNLANSRGFLVPGPEATAQLESVDDFEPSFNAGILFEPSEWTRIGIAYRSEVDLRMTGEFDLNDPPPLLSFLGLSDGDGSAEIPLPHTVRVSVYQKLTEGLALLANVGWEDWSVMQFTPITGPAGRTLSVPRRWRDTWHYALGLEWQATPSWLLQAGVAFDTDPSRDRSTTLPDLPVDRQWRFSAGLVHDWSESVQIGLNYTYIDLGRSPVDVDTRFGRLEGHYDDLHAHVLAASIQF